jgi:hypothetical protein
LAEVTGVTAKLFDVAEDFVRVGGSDFGFIFEHLGLEKPLFSPNT